MFMADVEINLQGLLSNVVKESEKKVLVINGKKTESVRMVVSKRKKIEDANFEFDMLASNEYRSTRKCFNRGS